MEKRADNNVVIIKQGSVMEHDVEKMLFGAPQYMRATTIEIENKESHPIVVEIDTSNVSIYDTETLAHTLSKEAMECSDKKKLVMGHNFTRGFISSLAVSFALSWPGIANRILHKEALNMPFIRWGYLLLPSIAALGLGYYICKSINASRANILESEEELLFEQHRQMFEHIILSFDDCIEIAPKDKIKQLIFYDTDPVDTYNNGQRTLTLRFTSKDKQTLVPLEL